MKTKTSKTLKEQVEIAYRTVRYSRAFSMPLGFICFRSEEDRQAARANEDTANQRAAQHYAQATTNQGQ